MNAATQSAAPRSLIPWIFVAGMALVLVVNGIMVTIAIDTFTGIAATDPYREGIEYNQALAAQKQQDALGWQLEIRRADGDLLLQARGPGGQPLDGLRLTARLVRPVEPLPDVAVEFAGEGGGIYRAVVAPPRPGQWDVLVDAVNEAGRFHLKQRVLVP